MEANKVRTSVVQIGRNKIAAYGAAVRRTSAKSVMQAIVDGDLYISYWRLAKGAHGSGLDFMTDCPTASVQPNRHPPKRPANSSLSNQSNTHPTAACPEPS